MAPTNKSSAASKSKIIILSLTKEKLAKFPHEQNSAISSSPSSSNVDSTTQPGASTSTPDTAAGVHANDGDASTPNGLNKTGMLGEKPGLKRTASQITLEAGSRARGKPGPKKKTKVDGPNGTMISGNGPKLNPKASAGIINANLRALDRSGTPCRKWKRAPFAIKTFTGAVWLSGSTWEAPAKPKPPVDENGKAINTGSSAASNPCDISKPNQDSSAVASEKSQNGDVSTPAMATMPAAVTA